MITPEELDTIVDQCERWWHPSVSSKDLADTAGRLVAEVRRLQEDLKAAQMLARQSEERANAEWARNVRRQQLEASAAREAG